VVCNDNLVTDLENSNGIWYDVGNVDGVFTNNRLQNVGSRRIPFNASTPWAGDNAFFFEISKGVTVAGNEFINCDQGVFILNSSGAEVYQNTFVNSAATIARTPRSAQGDHFGWHPASGPDVDERYDHVLTNNLFVATSEYLRPFIKVWQTPELCETLSDNPVKSMDGNVFVTNPAYSEDLIYWSPLPAEENCHQSFKNLAAFKEALPAMNEKSADYPLGSIPLFKGLHTANYELLPTFPGHERAVALPSRVQKLLQHSKKQKPYIGAHPTK
jgi:parallel beta-helix repeat protein